jgi:hypothetical protein
MVSGQDALVKDWAERGDNEPRLWETVDDIINLIGQEKYYWAGIALCDLRERLKDAK